MSEHDYNERIVVLSRQRQPRVLAIYRHDSSRRDPAWEIPHGTAQPAETASSAAERITNSLIGLAREFDSQLRGPGIHPDLILDRLILLDTKITSVKMPKFGVLGLVPTDFTERIWLTTVESDWTPLLSAEHDTWEWIDVWESPHFVGDRMRHILLSYLQRHDCHSWDWQ